MNTSLFAGFSRRLPALLLVVTAVPAFAVLTVRLPGNNQTPPPAPAASITPPPAAPPAPATAAEAAPNGAPAEKAAIVWDATSKDLDVKPGAETADFTFTFTNTSKVDAVLTVVRPSCGCTTAKLPPLPWTNAPGATGTVNFSINLHGKTGTLFKTVSVESTGGNFTLMLKAVLPDLAAMREANMQLAAKDRQAVFKGDCAACHVAPGIGKTGGELYKAVCGVCHEAEHRGTMVPDLHSLPHPTSAEHWRAWIVNGKADSLMPAFLNTLGGPLTQEQIDSVVDYLVANIPARAEQTSAPAPAH